MNILKEIVLRMNDYDTVIHFCNSAETVGDLCKTDQDIKTHLNNLNPSIKLNMNQKTQIKEANKIFSKKFPIELRKQILQKTFDEKLTIACLDKDIDIDVCEFRKTLCKEELQKLGLKPSDNFCYLYEEISKIIKNMKRYNISSKKLIEFTTTSLMQLTFSEKEISSIPFDVLDFIHLQKSKNGIISQQEKENKMRLILLDYHKTKNSGLLNDLDDLIINGTNIYIILQFAVDKTNINLINRFCQAPHLLNFVLQEAIQQDNQSIIRHIMNSVKNNKYPGDDIFIPNLKTKIVDYPNLIADIYYYKYNHLLPFFMEFASENDIIKAQIIYETKIY